MGVYIKGMEMPTHCIDCPFMVSRDDDDCILQSAEANENFENWEQMKAGCPLIPVPEHGRLIDADALRKSDRLVGKMMMFGGEYVYTQTEIDRAPAIIPADKEGE